MVRCLWDSSARVQSRCLVRSLYGRCSEPPPSPCITKLYWLPVLAYLLFMWGGTLWIWCGPIHSNGPSNGFVHIKIIKPRRHKKTGTLVILCTWVSLVAISGPKKTWFSWPTPSNGSCNGFAPIKGGGESSTKCNYFVLSSMKYSIFTSHRSPPPPPLHLYTALCREQFRNQQWYLCKVHKIRLVHECTVVEIKPFTLNRVIKQGFGSRSAWIRINLSCWIRIRIQIADPDPGGQKWPTKVEKSPEFSCF